MVIRVAFGDDLKCMVPLGIIRETTKLPASIYATNLEAAVVQLQIAHFSFVARKAARPVYIAD